MKHIHLIGIGGSGLSAIARVLLESGYEVSGSDRVLSPLADELEKAGAMIFFGHDEKNIQGADIIVRSSAVPDTNPEIVAAQAAGIPVQKRSDFLGNLISKKIDGCKRTALAVAGTHGKTTSTAMIAWILSSMGLDPSYIIGGISKNLASNAHAGNGEYFIIEADEYDNMFLGLNPDSVLITNVQHDHPDCFPTKESYFDAFETFIQRINPNGIATACADDDGAQKILQRIPAGIKTFTYGLTENGNYSATDLTINSNGGYTFNINFNANIAPKSGTNKHKNEKLATVSLKVPGRHNVLNATGAFATIHQLDLNVSGNVISQTLSEFLGTSRRFDIRGEAQGITIVDDYAHHPVEIRATISAAKDRFLNRRLWVVWQPHTYSRIKALFGEFIHAFDDASQVIVTEIYAAREQDSSFSSETIVTKMNHPGLHFIPKLDDVAQYLIENIKCEDVLLVLSAGDADKISTKVLKALQR